MRVSKKFPIAVHSLLIMARFENTDKATSAMIAQSTGSNPVIIRNIFIALKKNGLIESATGKNGGVRLAKAKKDISLWDVYSAVETDDIDEIFKFHEGSGSCAVGKNIYQLMLPHMDTALGAMRDQLRKVTLDTLTGELLTMIENQTGNCPDK
ncbi:RrF2 family transcriptional regulator [Breznakiella homolactica]|uniref:Rrf2 family transcriptional regulator n=1 Tax=Breznakiella homolactica TaxID=2798577 RepID=A0A7T8B905_9SPIR|nr:Rrf2 family transcriptional regulator [Breznakiella homolactica]QQO07851.1 Rrf2 family transcriptional regulator [Breznakiella homolactica]